MGGIDQVRKLPIIIDFKQKPNIKLSGQSESFSDHTKEFTMTSSQGNFY